MKKAIVVILLILLISLASCSSSDTSDSAQEASPSVGGCGVIPSDINNPLDIEYAQEEDAL